MNEYNMIKRTLQNETFPELDLGYLLERLMNYLMLNKQQRSKRISDYSRKVYHRVKSSKVVTRKPLFVNEKTHFMSIQSEVSVTEDTSSKG